MYGESTALVSGVASTVAGVALLPYTGGNSILTTIGLVAVAGGIICVLAQVAVSTYRRTTK